VLYVLTAVDAKRPPQVAADAPDRSWHDSEVLAGAAAFVSYRG